MHKLVPENLAPALRPDQRLGGGCSRPRDAIVKFFLHISRTSRSRRLEPRLDDPTKHWKFNVDDLRTASQWDDYMGAYEDALSRCSTAEAPGT